MRVQDLNDHVATPSRPGSLRRRSSAAALALPLVLALTGLLAGCGNGTSTGTAAGSTTGSSPSSSTTGPAPTAALTVSDAWVKTARPGMMTAAFGTLTNATDQPVTVLAATSPASTRVELHEMVMVNGVAQMRPKQGGIVVPAHGRSELKPGSYHIMLMNLTSAIKPGDAVSFTLQLSTGGSMSFEAVAKDFTGGNEKYQPSAGASSGGMSGMSGSGMASPSPSGSSGS